MRGGPSNRLQVLDEGFADRGEKRVNLRLTPLGSSDSKPVVPPIDVIEAERCNFTRAKAVDREQHQDGTITNVGRARRLQSCQQALYI